MKTLILGMGNPILTDDGVGLKIARRLKETRDGLEVVETSEAGIALLDLILGYNRLIVIDSIKIDEGEPGELYQLALEDLEPGQEFSSSHGIGLATAFALGQRLGYPLPQAVSIYAVNIKDNSTFGEECTEAIRKRLPDIVQQIIKEERL